MTAAAILDFWNFKFLTIGTVKKVKLITGTAEPKVVKFCTQVQFNSSNKKTYHQQKGRGYDHVTVLKFAVCRDAARRTGLSAIAELLVRIVVDISNRHCK